MPHRLYGHVDAAENYSVGRWLADVGPALDEVRAPGRVPVLVGGTGLYFKALTQGLAAVPPIPPEIRDDGARAAGRAKAPAALHAELAAPRSRDGAATEAGRPHADRARARGAGGDRAPAQRLAPRRAAAADRCVSAREDLSRARTRDSVASASTRASTRCSAAGALDEVRALAARRLDPLLPAMKAHGVPWLIRHLAGEITLARGSRGREKRHPPLHQAAIHLGSASAAGLDLDGARGRSRPAPCGLWGAETGTTTRRPRTSRQSRRSPPSAPDADAMLAVEIRPRTRATTSRRSWRRTSRLQRLRSARRRSTQGRPTGGR